MIFKKAIGTTSMLLEFSGGHQIIGKTLIKGGILGGCDVRLVEKRTGRLVFRTFSNSDGTYVFKYLKRTEYLVMAIDRNGEFNAVIQDNVVPK